MPISGWVVSVWVVSDRDRGPIDKLNRAENRGYPWVGHSQKNKNFFPVGSAIGLGQFICFDQTWLALGNVNVVATFID